MVDLCLRGCGKLNGKAVNLFIKRCAALSHIDLFDIPSAAVDSTFAGVRRTCKKLKIIRVGESSSIGLVNANGQEHFVVGLPPV
ncbi:hypothetical protein Pmar_PMAR012282 [Perkinsus marinus ATCC 50983]|nr:hypothetical protein Pmar_PMAR012282 [Perkinsus marinus ATCC 50983]EER07934.1 hypothetical protein Pmar_PMAR012282 [Perkinsus marinus ATCC 50983]|eukprot:XP_002776118.1 hypothetical protein Pmar_PMAR012282 [Perkinsus marinus ATCC 50983]